MVVSTSHNNSDHIGRGYHKPTRGILSYLPSSFVPYAELMRLNKPVGTLNIYFPYLFGSLFAACARYPFITPLSILSANLKLFPMAFLLRSAGCTWNDLVDRDLDRKVARCRLRPIARYAISPRSGFIFYVIQMLVWLAILLQTDAPTTSYAFSGVLMGHLYPFAKRFTYYPQVVLGFTLSWGILVGCVLQGVSPTSLAVEQSSTSSALACLFLSYVFWTITHDTIYGFQDIQDDAKAGIKSICQRHECHITTLLCVLAVLQVGFHAATGIAIHAGFLYYLTSCFGIATFLGFMIWSIDVKDPRQCWWWFQLGSLTIGWTIAAGLTGEYARREIAVGKS